MGWGWELRVGWEEGRGVRGGLCLDARNVEDVVVERGGGE